MHTDAQLWFSEIDRGSMALSYRIVRQLYHGRSQFQTIDVYETVHYGKLLVLDGIIMLTESDEFVYHDMLVHVPMLSHQRPERVLVIGGGDGGTVREVLRHEGIVKIDMVEIDEEVVKVCRRFLPSLSCKLDDPRVELIFQDAVEYVKGVRDKYDVVIVDSTDPVGLGEGLFTREFYGNEDNALKPHGVLAVQSESPFSLEGEMMTIHHKLKTVFPLARIYWAPVPCYPPGTWSFIYCSADGQEPEVRRNAAAEAIEAQCRYYNRKIHQAAFVLPNFMRTALAQ